MGAEENLPLVRMLNEVLVMLGNAVMPVMAGGNLDLKPKNDNRKDRNAQEHNTLGLVKYVIS